MTIHIQPYYDFLIYQTDHPITSIFPSIFISVYPLICFVILFYVCAIVPIQAKFLCDPVLLLACLPIGHFYQSHQLITYLPIRPSICSLILFYVCAIFLFPSSYLTPTFAVCLPIGHFYPAHHPLLSIYSTYFVSSTKPLSQPTSQSSTAQQSMSSKTAVTCTKRVFLHPSVHPQGKVESTLWS
uniref:Uncharacterized protein n=1 Tax=Cacopsylla melanoneura TaxID=428564 RepID=A0A8D8ZCQ4_9HEMI